MKTVVEYYVHQNLGLWDRVLRVVIGFCMIAIPFSDLMQPGASVAWWHGASMLVAVYPSLTGILGMDPMLRMIGVRTCGGSRRNQCGSFPYQVDAFFGHDPIPENHQEHELSHSSHAH